jgi:hypothetical protein
MGKSSRDLATEQLIIPPKLAKSYSDELKARDDAKQESIKLQSLLKQIARDLAARVGSSRLCGRPELPEFRALTPLPESITQLLDAMSDESLRTKLATLNGQLGVQLAFNPPAAPTSMSAARSAQPNIPSTANARPGRPSEPAPAAPSPVAEIPDTPPASEPLAEQETEFAADITAHESVSEEPRTDEERIEGFFTD